MNHNPLATELAYYEAQKQELLKHHEGKFALIKGEELVGTFDTEGAAYQAGVTKFGNVPMFIRQVLREQPKESAPALTHGVLRAYP